MNSNQILVSICCITYNHDKYISQAIEGFLMQKTSFSFEIIIGEDCSTDRTREIVLEYQRNNPDVIRIVKSEANMGGRANGVRTRAAATGKYIAICEGDDYWTDPYKLQKQLDFLEANRDCSWCFHAARVVYEDGSHPNAICKPKKIPSSKKFEAKDVILGGGGFYATASAMFVSDAIRDTPEWFVSAPVGDFPLALMASYKGNAGYLDDVMCVYRKGTGGAWTDKMKKDWDTLTRFHESSEDYLRAFNEYSCFTFDKYLKLQVNKLRHERLEKAFTIPGSVWDRLDRLREIRSCCASIGFSGKLLICWNLVKAALNKMIRKLRQSASRKTGNLHQKQHDHLS